MEKFINNRILQNIIFWLLYAVIPFFINLSEFRSLPNMYTDAQFYIECAVLGYFNNLFLMPRLFDQKRYRVYFSTIVLTVLAFNFLSGQITLMISPNYNNGGLLGYIYEFSDFMIFVIAFCSGRLIRQYLHQLKHINLLEEKRLKAELDFLKAQINPHLLFNTLNTIYSNSLERSPKTPQMILKLSEIMRYMLYETNVHKVSLNKEIEYIKNYIALQELRIQGRGQIKASFEGDVGSLKIAPMLLISFVENAFKYSMDSLSYDIEIVIKLYIENNTLSFEVNNKYEALSDKIVENGGFGIANTRKRLELTYPQCHELQILDDQRTFSVKLTLELDD